MDIKHSRAAGEQQMRKFIGLFFLTAALTGCGQKSTPLVHAISALRAGDHADFLTAKAEADDAKKTAIQPGGDLCLMTMMDIEKYGTVAVQEKMDQPEVFRAP
jgi:hypothetical protein